MGQHILFDEEIKIQLKPIFNDLKTHFNNLDIEIFFIL